MTQIEWVCERCAGEGCIETNDASLDRIRGPLIADHDERQTAKKAVCDFPRIAFELAGKRKVLKRAKKYE